MTNYHGFLLRLRQLPASPYIHGWPISFTTGQDCSNRRDFNSKNNSTFSEFWNPPKGRRSTWLGIFVTPTQSTVTVPGNRQVWHCWAAAVIKDGSARTGKHILIYDCDPSSTDITGQRRKTVLNGYQEKFVQYAEKQAQISGVWYNTDASRTGEDQCVSHTREWVQKMAVHGESTLTAEDLRLRGFSMFTRK